jgi:hypothetical protein
MELGANRSEGHGSVGLGFSPDSRSDPADKPASRAALAAEVRREALDKDKKGAATESIRAAPKD